MMLNPAYSNGKSPNRRVGGFAVFCFGSGFLRRRPDRSCPPQIPLLALGAVAIHRSGLETAFFQPALDPVFGEADVRFNPGVGNETAHTSRTPSSMDL